MLSEVASFEHVLIVVQLIGDCSTINLHASGKDDQLKPLANLRSKRTLSLQMQICSNALTTSRKKSTWGRLWTKNLTGWRSMVTLRTKSGGVPGLTICLTTPSWWEWMSVSSRSKTSVFRLTRLSLCPDSGERGRTSYRTVWYWATYRNDTSEANTQKLTFLIWQQFNECLI